MASDTNNTAEENFNKFRESMYQYLNEPVKDFAAVKPQLLDIFKTHRPIRNVDYQYGLSKSLKGKSQLIIHEFSKNRSAVREYFKAGNQVWHCCECARSGASKNDDGIADLLVVHGIVFVKLEHDCKPRELSFVQKVQKLYIEKKIEEADALQKEVLGSEDLISSKQKSGATKCGTKVSSSQLEEDLIAEIKLRLAQYRQDNSEPSPLDEEIDENQEKLSPEEAFTKIIENLEEYTTESKKAVIANKSKLLTYLKTHRPVKKIDLQYGLSKRLTKNWRLIVFEFGDRRKVREYTKKSDCKYLWRCRECERLYRYQRLRTSYSFLYLVNGISFVEMNHHSFCKPRDYELVMIYQKFLEDGDISKAYRMAKLVNFTYGENNFAIFKNHLDNNSLKERNVSNDNNEVVKSSKRKMKFDSGESSNTFDEFPVHKKSKHNTVADENNYVFVEELPIRNKSKYERSASTVTPSIYHFEKPLTSKLQEICDKLNTQHRNKAAKLWDKILFDQVDTVAATPTETHYFETDNFYQILSIFFTGKSKQHEQIKRTIIDAFREKMVSSGEISSKKFNKRYLDTVTDEHFDFIAKYLSCRILIVDDENGITKFGKWKSNASIRLTLVVAFKGGYYSIVLNL